MQTPAPPRIGKFKGGLSSGGKRGVGASGIGGSSKPPPANAAQQKKGEKPKAARGMIDR